MCIAAAVPTGRGRGRLEETLHDVPGQAIVKRTLVTGQNPTGGILSRIDDNDLVVVGYSRRSDLQRWLYGDFSRELLNRAPGPVVLTSRMIDPITDDNLVERLLRWGAPHADPSRAKRDGAHRTGHGIGQSGLHRTHYHFGDSGRIRPLNKQRRGYYRRDASGPPHVAADRIVSRRSHRAIAAGKTGHHQCNPGVCSGIPSLPLPSANSA